MEVKKDMNKDTDISNLIIKCRSHDDDAFDELLRRYTPMIRKVIAGFDKAGVDTEELFAEGCVALHTAACRFDIGQDDVTFGLYARICVRNRLVDVLRRAEAERKIADYDIEQMADDESPEVSLAERERFYQLLDSAKELLSDYEYRVLLLHIQGYKTAAIAQMLSRSPKSVDNAKSRLFRHLRKEIGDISKI